MGKLHNSNGISAAARIVLVLLLSLVIWPVAGYAQGGPVVDVWYGNSQDFGQIGNPQWFIDILGNVSDPDGVASLEYTLNGGSVTSLSVGPDGRRLHSTGDFCIDILTSDLINGSNTILITATDDLSNETIETVTVQYDAGNVWPLPYAVNWSAVTDIMDVSPVIDGLWELEPNSVRTSIPGYDRLLGIGDTMWHDYEVTVPITIYSMDPNGAVGVLLRWMGHTDLPVSAAGLQPKSGWLPLGAILRYKVGELNIYANGSTVATTPRTLTIGTTYMFKGRVETNASGGRYSFKVWEQGTSEPSSWDVTAQEGFSDPQFGSVLLFAHHTDVSFGNVTVGSTAETPVGAWVAFNDMNSFSGDDNESYVTLHDYNAVSASLTDSITNTTIPAVTMTGSWVTGYSPTTSSIGGQTNVGTDAANIFGPSGSVIVDLERTIQLSAADWENVITFDNLDPNKEYNIALTTNRDNSFYTNQRYTRVTIEGANAFTNASSSGVVVNSPASVSFSTGYNRSNGFVAAWTGVTTGPDGSFSVKSEWDSSQPGTKGYAMTAFRLEEAYEEPTPHTLTVSIVGNGSVAKNPDETIYNSGDVVQLTAQADPGWVFDSWSGDLTGSTNPESITMNADKNVTATFVAVPFFNWAAYNDLNPLNSTNAPNVTEHDYTASGGILKRFDTGVDLLVAISGDTVGGYNPGTEGANFTNVTSDAYQAFNGIVDVTGAIALDAAGWDNIVTFDNLDPVKYYTVTLTANRDNPTYDGERFTRVMIEGADAFTNASSAGVIVNSPASVSFSTGYNTSNGYVARWSGILSGSDGSFSVKSEWDDGQPGTRGYAMNAFCLEEFDDIPPPPQYTLTVITVGNGSVAKLPDEATYDAGTVVQLTATQDPGWVFDGWSGDLTGSTNPENITMDGSKSVTATFVELPTGDWVAYNDLNPAASSNAPNVTEHDYTASGAVLKRFDSGTNLLASITGTIIGGYNPGVEGGNFTNVTSDAYLAFNGIVDAVGAIALDAADWDNIVTFDGLDPSKYYTVTLTANRDNIAYDNQRYTRATIEGADAFTNTSSSGVIVNSPASVSFSTGYNTVNGYVARWIGIETGVDGSFSVKSEWDTGQPGARGYSMNVFCLEESTDPPPPKYTLTVNTVGNGTVAKLPDEATYDGGTIVQLTATADPGWEFDSWSGDLTGSANPENITMDADKVVTATFLELPPLDNWVAFNDMNSFSGDENASYVTLHDYNAVAALLTDSVTNTTVPAVTMTGSWVNGYEPTTSDIGDQTSSGTDAADIFGPSGSVIVDIERTIQISAADWDNVITFDNLDPTKIYNITLTTNRDNSFYTDQRYSRVTIEGAVAFTNASSSGVIVNSPASVSFSTGYNRSNGYVAAWTGVTTGPDGSFSVKSEWDSSQPGTKGYAMTAFRLEQVTPITHTLATATVGGGTITKLPNQSTYIFGDVVQLTAQADPGWVFDSWSGDLTGSTNPENITMDADKNVTATFVAVPFFSWAAYNDLNPLNSTNAPNVTEHDYTVSAGILKRLDTGVDLLVAMSGDTVGGYNPGTEGANFTNVTSDAYQAFNGIADVTGAIALDAVGWDNIVTFDNLDPVKYYTVTLTANRDNPTYDGERFTRVTIEGADAFTNASSDGVIVNSPASVSFSTGYNTDNGYVARWSGILSGSDGSFSVKSEWDDGQPGTRGYAMNVFCLEEFDDIPPPPQYTLTVITVGNGSVAKLPDEATYDAGTVVQLTATADPDWLFTGWSGDLTGSANPENITMDGNKSVTATFAETFSGDWVAFNDMNSFSGDENASYVTLHDYNAVSALLADSGSGQVIPVVTMTGSWVNGYEPTTSSIGDQASSGTDAANIFGPSGSVIVDIERTIQISAADWDNVITFDNLDPTKIYNITLTTNRDNSFYTDQRFSRVTLEGAVAFTNASSSGVVVNSPASVSFSTGYNRSNGYVAAWTGVTTGPDGSFSVKSEWDSSQPGTKGYAMTAFRLEQVTPIIYTLGTATVGSGTITKLPDQSTYNSGDVVQLTAQADPGWVFDSWSGDLTGSANPENITMDADKNVTATFVAVPFFSWAAYNDLNPLNSSNAPNVTEHDYTVSAGILKRLDTGVDLLVAMSGDTVGGYNPGTEGGNFTNASSDAYQAFNGIVDVTGAIALDATGWDNIVTFDNLDPVKYYTVTLTANRDNLAYDNQRYTRVTIEGADAFTNASSAGVIVNSPASVSFSTGYNTSNGYVARWSGILSGADGSFSVKSEWDDGQPGTRGYAMNVFCLEEFDDIPPPPQYTLTIITVGNGSVAKLPDQATYDAGTVVQLTATADPDWLFTGWSGDLSGSANPDNITMDGSKSVTATFVEVPTGDWVAFNDMNSFSGDNNASYVTLHDYNAVAASLADSGSGLVIPVVAMTASWVNGYEPTTSSIGGQANVGTDAADIFGPSGSEIVDLERTIQLSAADWENVITFNNLVPTRTYNITLTTNRNDTRYADQRFTRVTIEGADAFTNASSAGVVVNSPASVSFSAGYNTANGYVAAWTGITTGPDGSFSVKSEWDSSQPGTKGYAMTAFRLEEISSGPTITSSPVTDAVIGQPYIYDVEATGTPPLVYSLTTQPTGMTIDANTGLISWTPTAPQEGDNPVEVEVSDAEGTTTQSFIVAVVDPVPNITSTPITDGAIGVLYSYDVEATGSPAPTFSLTTNPTGMTIDANTGLISWTPVAGQEGNQAVSVLASNGAGTDPQSFDIFVADAPGCVLQATTLDNLTTDDLLCTYDLVGGAVTAASAWYRNSLPQMALYMPMEGGAVNALLDYSGNGNDAVAVGTPTWGANSGPDGFGAYTLDNSDHLTVADSPTLDLDFVTLATWINLNSYQNDQRIISKEFGDTQPYSIYTLLMDGSGESKLEMRVGLVGQDRVRVSSSSDVPLGEWVHVAATFDGSEIIVYINGVADGSTPATGILRHNDEPVYVGGSQFSTPRFLDGMIDDVRVYGHALSPEQIASLYSVGRDVIVAQETSAGDEWRVEVTSFSASAAFVPCVTNTLTIQPLPSAAAVDPEVLAAELPDEFDLAANFPNPFNPTTEIGFNLPVASHVRIDVYNIVGQLVTTLVDERREAGYHSVVWDGNSVASGVYLYRLEAGSFVETRKMVLLK